ncbi:hypothetical protein [Rhizobium yanglingense]
MHLAKMLKAGGNVHPPRRTDQRPRYGNAGRARGRARKPSPAAPLSSATTACSSTGLATHILAFEGDSHVEWFEGNFEDYEQDKVRRLGPDTRQARSRVTYKRLTR